MNELPSDPPPLRLTTVAELAALLGMKPGTIYSWVEDERIPHLRLNRSIRFRPSDVDAILAEGLTR